MKKIVFLIIGSVFLILGVIGLMLPVIPQVPFLILAAIFFMRGSPWLHRKIVGSSIYQEKILPFLKDYPVLRKLMDDTFINDDHMNEK